ncbi:MAG: TetR/AcrR family transcriptional regulator [Candidatus Methylomirabilales bacterium]
MTTKGRIEKVATREFARYGFDGVSVRQIAAEAHITKPVLYYYFKDKRDLYLSLLERAIVPLCDEVERIAERADSPQEQMEAIVAAFLRFFRERPEQFQLLHRAVERREREVQLIAQKYFRRIFLALSRVLHEGVDLKAFRPLGVTQTTFSIIAILVYYCTRAHVIDEVLGHKKAAESLMDSLGQQILGLLKT